MAKRRTKRAARRAQKKSDKLAGMNRPSGQSKYGQKDRKKEIARGYSTRPASPFFLPESMR